MYENMKICKHFLMLFIQTKVEVDIASKGDHNDDDNRWSK